MKAQSIENKLQDLADQSSPAKESACPPATTISRRLARSAVRTASDLASCLDAVEAVLRTYPQIDGHMINFYQPEEQNLVCVRLYLPNAFSVMESAYSNYTFPIDNQDAHSIAFSTQAPVRVTPRNIKEFSAATQARFEFWKMRSLVAMPILATDSSQKPIGTLVMFSQTCVLPALLINSVASLLADASPLLQLHRKAARLEAHIDSIRMAKDELQALMRFIADMNCLTTETEIYPRIEREFISRFDLDFAAVLMAEDGLLRCVDTRFIPSNVSWGKAWQAHCRTTHYSLDFVDGASADAYIANRPLYFRDIPSIRHLPMGAQDKANLEILQDLQTFAVLPIRRHGRPIGVLWLGSTRRLNALSAEQLVLIQHLCDFMGSVIENAHVYTMLTTLKNQVEVLDDLASRDRLTGLYNYGSFEIEITKRLHAFHLHPKPAPISLVMCDIDHFKRFNDANGHVAGNVVLQETARRILEIVRDSDFVARYGGEEFTILFSGCDLRTAVQRAERIRRSIAGTPFVVDGVGHTVTLSLGCAELMPHEDSASLVTRADKALYCAKEGGRNRVAQAPPEISTETP